MTKTRITTKTKPHEYGHGGIRVITNHGKKKYQFTYFENGKKHRPLFNYNDDGLREAETFQAQIVQNKKDGITGTNKSLYDMIEKHLEHKKKKLTEATLLRKTNTLFALYKLNEAFMNKPFDTISVTDIQSALNIVEINISTSEAHKAFILLNETFRDAVNNDIIRKNLCDRVERPVNKTSERTIFSSEEIVRTFSTIAYMKKDPMYHLTSRDYFTLFLFLFCTGTRINEALATKWEDIIWDDKPTIHIQRTIDSHHVGGGQITKATKTRAGNRFIPLPPRLIRRLKKIRPEKDAGYIFPTSTGTALDVHNFHRTWDAIFRATARECPSCHTKRPTTWKCNCGNQVTHNAKKCSKCKGKRPDSWNCPKCGTVVAEIHHTPHEIRHTYASYLVNNGIPDTTIAYLLGHSSTNVLWSTYAHKPTNYYDQLTNLFNSKSTTKKT